MSVQNTVNYIPPRQIESDPLWVNDFSILLKKEKLTEFFPTKFQTNEERLNAVVRLSLYTSILLSVYHSNMKYTSILIFTLFLTYIVYKNHPESPANIKTEPISNIEKETLSDQQMYDWNTYKSGKWREDEQKQNTNENCTRPTPDNPFMNATMKTYLNIDKNNNIIPSQPACDPNNPDIKKEIDSNFNNNLYNDVSDMFGKLNSQRNFYTMPWTTIPNDPNLDFAKWLYASPQSCKEDPNACIRGIHEDIRQNRFVFPEPTINPVSSKKLE